MQQQAQKHGKKHGGRGGGKSTSRNGSHRVTPQGLTNMIMECQSIDELEKVGNLNVQCWIVWDMHALIKSIP